MSEALGTEVKTNPQGDPITSVAAPKPAGDVKKDPHAEAKKQRVVTPEHLFLEAPRVREFITGSEAAKEAVRRSNVDLAIAYPITPQSEPPQMAIRIFADPSSTSQSPAGSAASARSQVRTKSTASKVSFFMLTTATQQPGRLRKVATGP